MTGKNLLRGILLQMRDSKQQMLRRNVFVLEVRGFFESLLQQLAHGIRERRLRRFTGNFRQLLHLTIDIAEHSLRTDADFFEHRRDDSLFIFKQRREQMYGQQLGVAMLRGELVRALDGFLRFNC